MPASIATLDDAQTWGAQLGAEIVGVPPTRGSVNRLAGTHVYLGTIDVDTQWQVQARAARFGTTCRRSSPTSSRTGRCGRASSSAAYEHFDTWTWRRCRRRAVDDGQGRVRVPPARLVHPLRGHVRADRELPGLLRPGRGDRAVRVAGLVVPGREQTFYSRTDEELWRLAGRARELGVDAALQHGSPPTCGPGSPRCAAARRGSRIRRLPRRLRAARGGDLPDRHPVLGRGPHPRAVLDRHVPRHPAGFDFNAGARGPIAERDQRIDEAARGR